MLHSDDGDGHRKQCTRHRFNTMIVDQNLQKIALFFLQRNQKKNTLTFIYKFSALEMLTNASFSHSCISSACLFIGNYHFYSFIFELLFCVSLMIFYSFVCLFVSRYCYRASQNTLASPHALFSRKCLRAHLCVSEHFCASIDIQEEKFLQTIVQRKENLLYIYRS